MRTRWQLAGMILGAVGLAGCLGASPERFGEPAGESVEGADDGVGSDGDIDTDYEAEGLDGTFSIWGDTMGPEVEDAEIERNCLFVPGNPTCEDHRLGTEVLRVESVQSDTYAADQGTVTLTVSADGTAVGFTSTMPIHGVIVKAAGHALVCEYTPETYADTSQEVAVTDLLPKQNAISHVAFCELELSQVVPPDPAD